MTSRASPRLKAARGTTTSGTDNGAAATGNTTSSDKNKPGYFFQSQGFKRFSVVLSIALSVASLIVGAIAQLMTLSTDTQRGLAVTGIIVNAISVALSALTSLDWRSEAQQDKKFLDQLFGLVDISSDGKVSMIKQVP